MQNRLNKENVNSFSIFCLFILLREPIFNSLVSNFLCLLCLCRNIYAKKNFKIFPKVGLYFMHSSCPKNQRLCKFFIPRDVSKSHLTTVYECLFLLEFKFLLSEK